MRRCALALALLCQGAHGGKGRANLLTSAAENKAAKKASLTKALRECEDGTDCNSHTCKKIAEEEAKTETCEAAPAILAATNPRGKNIASDPTDPFCVQFNDPSDTQGFAPCPGVFDNIDVAHSTANPYSDDSTNPLTGDNYLHLKDGSGGSLACGTGSDYTGDWSSLATSECRDLCFDVKLFRDGCHSGVAACSLNAAGTGYYIDIFPYIILQGGPPDHFRAAFKAYDFMTDDDGNSSDWRRVCAPLGPLDDAGELPSNEFGYWYMAAPNDILSGASPIAGPASPNAAWPALLSDVVAIQLPIDFTGNPAERAGYDSICVKERDCEDPCDPEPLCYWQHEWSCEDAKKEEWYSNFTALVSPLETFPKKFCLCKILKDCCPDLCDFAEQEFAALLLNVASGRLALDCGVEECDDCLHNVSSVISMVDQLLAPSSRSDYDCSRALQLLTGINHDEILCDSPPDPEPCPQTEECFVNDGICVPTRSCIPSPTVACEGHFCGDGTGEECTCEMAIPCNQTDACKDQGGRCIKNCESIPGVVDCADICAPEDPDTLCMCEIKKEPCQQTTLCEDNGGRCVKEEDCAPPFQCTPQFCDLSDGCVCKITDPLPCGDVNFQCQNAGGECVKDCFPIANVRKCVDEYCSDETGEPDACSCKIEKPCEDEQQACAQQKGGECKVVDDCDPSIFVCDPDLCGNGDLCVCEYTSD